MTNKKYVVHLSSGDRKRLRCFATTGDHNAREFLRAWMLLLSDKGETDERIHDVLGVSARTIERTRQAYVDDGLEVALYDMPRSGQPHKLSQSQEAQIMAIACSAAPAGRDHWTVALLREEAISRGIIGKISREPIRLLLKRSGLKPWQKKRGAFQR